jgi:hypothetical protein
VLEEHGFDYENKTVQVCNSCTEIPRKGRLIKFSLANGFWVGKAPPELLVLTEVEQSFVALVHVYKKL